MVRQSAWTGLPPPFHHPSSIPRVSDGWAGSPAKDRAPLPLSYTRTHRQIQSPVWLMDVGALQLALCCDKQQMFSNNVYRLGLHPQMTHTCFQSNRPREAIHLLCSGWPPPHCISPCIHEDGHEEGAGIQEYIFMLRLRRFWMPDLKYAHNYGLNSVQAWVHDRVPYLSWSWSCFRHNFVFLNYANTFISFIFSDYLSITKSRRFKRFLKKNKEKSKLQHGRSLIRRLSKRSGRQETSNEIARKQ